MDLADLVDYTPVAYALASKGSLKGLMPLQKNFPNTCLFWGKSILKEYLKNQPCVIIILKLS